MRPVFTLHKIELLFLELSAWMGHYHSKINTNSQHTNPTLQLPQFAIHGLEFLYQFNRDSVRFMTIGRRGNLSYRALAWGFLNNRCPKCSSHRIDSVFDKSTQYAKWECVECSTSLTFMFEWCLSRNHTKKYFSCRSTPHNMTQHTTYHTLISSIILSGIRRHNSGIWSNLAYVSPLHSFSSIPPATRSIKSVNAPYSSSPSRQLYFL